MSRSAFPLPLVLVLLFVLLGPIAASAVGGVWSAPVLALSWAIAVALVVVFVRRLSKARRIGGRGR